MQITFLVMLWQKQPPEVFCKKAALKTFEIFTGKHFCWTLQTHHVYSTLKRRGNDRFHVVSTSNTRGVFVGESLFNKVVGLHTG